MWDGFPSVRIDIRVDSKCGAYIMIEPSRFNPVKQRLRQNDIPFNLEDCASSCKGTPDTAVIEFGKNADCEKIRRVLDDTE